MVISTHLCSSRIAVASSIWRYSDAVFADIARHVIAGNRAEEMASSDDDACVERFREFVRIPSIAGEGPVNGSYAAAAAWIVARCQEMGIEVKVISPVANKPIVIARVPGSDPTLPSIILNSHYDVSFPIWFGSSSVSC